MSLAGFLLMPAGWMIVLAAVALLPPAGSARPVFLLAGITIQVLGVVLAVRSHAVSDGEER